MPRLNRVRQFLIALSLPLLLAADSIDVDLSRAEDLIQKEQFPPAEALLVEAARKAPANAQVLYRLGYVQYRQRKLALARQNFKAVVKLAPPALHSRYFLGRIALIESKPSEAIEWLEPITQSSEVIFDSHAQLAHAYGTTQPEKAVALLKTAISQAPWDSTLPYRLGQIYQRLGKTELAREEFGNSARLKNLNREDVETLMQVSESLRARNAAQAAETGAKILDRPNADPDTLVALGVLYGTADLPHNALKAFDTAANRNESLFQAQFNRGLALLRLNRVSDAIPSLEHAAKLLPQSSDANITLGLAHVMSQKYKEAIEPLERGWQMDSSNPRVASLLATAYVRSGEPAKALPVLRAVATKSSDPTALFLLVEVLNAVENKAGALEAARSATQRFPTNGQAHLALAQQLARLGRYQEAKPEFEEVLRLMPGHPEAELGAADSLQKAGDHAAAVGHYRAAMSGSTTELAARLGLARSLTTLRQLDEAAQVLEQALPRHPSDAAVRLELSRVYARAGKTELAAEQAKIAERLKAPNP